MPPHTSASPAKKQSKWSPEEDALLTELRGQNVKWEDISARLPGRSAISCRLHYQNYLERRTDWDDERMTKLARLYERFKSEMWAKVAEELKVPWRAAEAMHWQIGEAEMARRAGVVPFSLSTAANEPQGRTQGLQHIPPTRGHAQSRSQGSLPRDPMSLPSPRYNTRSSAAGFTPPPNYPPPASFGPPMNDQASYGYGSGPVLGPGQGAPFAPMQTSPLGRGTGGSVPGRTERLPSVAEMTAGVSPGGGTAGTEFYLPPSGYAPVPGPPGGGGGGGGGGCNVRRSPRLHANAPDDSGGGTGTESYLPPSGYAPFPAPPGVGGGGDSSNVRRSPRLHANAPDEEPRRGTGGRRHHPYLRGGGGGEGRQEDEGIVVGGGDDGNGHPPSPAPPSSLPSSAKMESGREGRVGVGIPVLMGMGKGMGIEVGFGRMAPGLAGPTVVPMPTEMGTRHGT